MSGALRIACALLAVVGVAGNAGPTWALPMKRPRGDGLQPLSREPPHQIPDHSLLFGELDAHSLTPVPTRRWRFQYCGLKSK